MDFIDVIEMWTSFTENCVKFTKLFSKNSFWEFASGAADPADPAEVVSASAAQTSPLHAPGVRMTGVKQTPSNYMDLYVFVFIYIEFD